MPIRVEDIALAVEPLAPDATFGSALTRFLNTPDLTALPVVFEGAVIGMISRCAAMELALQGQKNSSIRALPVTRMMGQNPELVPTGMAVAYLAQKASEGRSRALEDGAVLVCEGYYQGYLPPHVIAEAVVRENTARAKAIKAAQARIKTLKMAGVTERRKTNAFLALMAHEIRTPLTGVIGVADLLKDVRLTGQSRQYADTISQSGQSLARLLNDLLDYARMETHHLQIQPEPVDLVSLVRETQRLWTGDAEGGDIALRVALAPGSVRRIEADPVRLRQILDNLISNALKFTEAGHIDVTLKAKAAKSGEVMLTITVADTGRGIKPADKARLFAAWQQAEAGDARLSGGAGLGLAVARGLARRMGGDIALADNPGGGAVFTVRCIVARAGPRLAHSNKAVLRGGHFALGHILVAEDHATSRLVVEKALTAAGWTVDLVHTGDQALRRGEGKPYQAILLDIHMPGLSGEEVVHRLRAGKGPNARAPILSLSADISEGRRQRSRAAGFDGFIDKPVRPRELVATLADAILLAETPGSAMTQKLRVM